MIGVVFSKMILVYLKSPKIARNSGVVNTAEKLFLKIMGCLLVIGVVFSKLILGYFKSPKLARNLGTVSFCNFKAFMYWRC